MVGDEFSPSGMNYQRGTEMFANVSEPEV